MNSVKSLFLLLVSLSFISKTEVQAHQRISDLDSITRLADSLKLIRHYKQAKELYHSASLLSQDKSKTVKLIVGKAECLIYLGDLSEAEATLHGISVPIEKNSYTEQHLNYIQGLLKFYQANYDLAISSFKAALRNPKGNSEELNWNAQLLNFIAYSFYYQSSLDSAILYGELQKKSLSKLYSLNKERWKSKLRVVTREMAHLHLERGHYDAALKGYSEWAQLAAHTPQENLALTYYGRTLVEIGAVQQGLDALKNASSTDKNLIGIALLAEVYLKTNEIEKADSTINALFMHLSRRPERPWLLAVAEFTKGSILVKKKEFHQSVPLLRQAINTLITQDPNSIMIPHGYRLWYRSLLQTRQFEKADSLSQALENHKILQNSIHWLHFELEKISRDIYLGNEYNAQESLLSIIDQNQVQLPQGVQGYFDPWLQIQSYRRLTELKSKTEKQAEAVTFDLFKKADEVVSSLRMTYLEYHDQIGLSDSLHQFYQEAIDYGFRLYSDQPTPEMLADIYRLIERSKSISLYHHIQLKSSQFDQPPGEKNELLIDQDLDYLYQVLFRKSKAEKNNQTLIERKLLKLEQDKGALVAQERFEGTDFNEFSSIKVKEDESIISYYLGKKYAYGIVIDSKGLHQFRLVEVSQLKPNIRKILKMVSEPDLSQQSFESYQEIAYSLYQQLFSEIPDEHLNTNLTIIPDGILHYLPFDLLLINQKGSDYKSLSYLLSKHVIRYSQSLSILLHLEDHAPNTTSRVLAMAPNKFENTATTISQKAITRDFGSLIHNNSEAIHAVDELGGTLLLGEEATETAFKAQLSNHSILHLATHAKIDHKYPFNSSIIFQNNTDSLNDGRFYAWEVFNSQLNGSMVVLSGCETGAGKLFRGEAPQSLASSFFSAGASSLLMSMWKANDLSTSILMNDFYSNLSLGYTKDIALQKAKRNFINQANEAQAHPYFWGGFVLMGDIKPIKKTANAYLWPALVLFIALIVLAFSIKIRQKNKSLKIVVT